MKLNSMKKMLSVILCIVLIAAMALFTTGCSSETPETTPGTTAASAESVGATFTFVVVDLDGNETSFEITTDADTVGEALLAEGLIEGENAEYGMYIKAVNGITADYEVDQTYWAFYVNGEYALSGVDTTDVTDGATYSLVQTKG